MTEYPRLYPKAFMSGKIYYFLNAAREVHPHETVLFQTKCYREEDPILLKVRCEGSDSLGSVWVSEIGEPEAVVFTPQNPTSVLVKSFWPNDSYEGSILTDGTLDHDSIAHGNIVDPASVFGLMRLLRVCATEPTPIFKALIPRGKTLKDLIREFMLTNMDDHLRMSYLETDYLHPHVVLQFEHFGAAICFGKVGYEHRYYLITDPNGEACVFDSLYNVEHKLSQDGSIRSEYGWDTGPQDDGYLREIMRALRLIVLDNYGSFR